jgi:hypothetical protein
MSMALSYEFLIQRAEQAAQEAAGSLLENVKERALRSEKAWRTMADQALEVARNRELAQQERLVAGQWHGAPQ